MNYSVYGFLPDEWAEVRFTTAPLAGLYREELLSLPHIDPRIPQLARTMTAGATTEAEEARAIESHLRHDYGYTLQLLSKPVPDPLAYFLFERKKGHCEYFASAMAVMLRTVGIPSRVVTGFQSGTYNSMTGWQVVRASDAHSWVEAWLDGRGWTTFDPTPADPSASLPGLSSLAMLSDAADQFWQDWVVSYDVDRQMALFTQMHESGKQFRFPQFDQIAREFDGFRARWALELRMHRSRDRPLVYRRIGDKTLVAASGPRAKVGARTCAAFGRHDSVSAIFAAPGKTRRAQAPVANSGGVRAGADQTGSCGAGGTSDRCVQRHALRRPSGSRVAADARAR